MPTLGDPRYTHRMRRLLLFLLLVLAGCGRDALSGGAPDDRVVLRIVPDSEPLFVGQTYVFDVERVTAEGIEVVTDDPGLQLAVTNDGVATLIGTSVVSVGPGTTELLARLDGAQGQTRITVVDATLESLSVEPADVTIAVGARVQLEVFGRLSDGRVIDLTPESSGTRYGVSPTGVADISPDGLLEGRSLGSAVVTVNQAGAAAEVRVTVVDLPDDITSIRIEPNPVQLESGAQRRVTVIGAGEGEVVLPASELTFSTDGPAIATVDAEGIVRAVSPAGETTLRVDFRGLSATADVVVGDPERRLVDLRIEPAEFELEVGGRQQLEVRAVFDDGLQTDVSSDPQTAYTSESGAVTVSAEGLVVGQSAGDDVVRAAFGGRTAEASVAVFGDSPVLELVVEPNPVALEVGGSTEVLVQARFQSGELRDVTAEAAFTAPPGDVLRYDAERRTLTGIREGFGDFGFTFRGARTDVPFVVFDDIDEVELRIEPNPIVLAVDEQTPFTLIAVFPTGLEFDITLFPLVSYRLTDPVAEVEPGLIRGRSAGAAELVAEVDDLEARALVEVLDERPELDRIVINAPREIRLGRTANFQVVAIFTDGTGQVITGSPDLNLEVEPADVLGLPSPGTLSGLREGEGVLSASFLGFEDRVDVRVTRLVDPPGGLEFDPDSLRLEAVESAPFRVLLQSPDGTTDVTNDPRLLLVRSREVWVSREGGQAFATALRNGSGRVEAFFEGLQAVLPVTVVGPSVIGIRIDAPDELAEGATAFIFVFADLSDGSDRVIPFDTPGFDVSTSEPAVATVTNGLLRALSEGETELVAELGDIVGTKGLTVVSTRIPTLTRLSPEAIDVGAPAPLLTVIGFDFQAGDELLIDGQAQAVIGIRPTEIRLTLPADLVAAPAVLEVQVRSPAGLSNTLFLRVGEPPSIASLVPDIVVVGETTRLRALGGGLQGLSGTGPRGWTVDNIVEAPDGSWAEFDVAVPGTTPANRFFPVQLRNALGAAATIVLTRDVGPALVIRPSDVDARETGTVVLSSLTIQAGATLAAGNSTEPLVFLVTGDIVIDGILDARGIDGRIANEPRGGEGGPGGGGGGGGGDGNAVPGALGGSGAPSGAAAPAGTGVVGTPGANGGGTEAGQGAPQIPNACGGGGGGGASVGAGGDGGANGGDGGDAPGSSDFGAGTGGGGGNACLPRRGAGGSGGGGGGLLVLRSIGGGDISIGGEVLVDGGRGGNGTVGSGGGGGGSGGVLQVVTDGGTITFTAGARLSARGGRGGNAAGAGGGGGGGRIEVDAGATGSIVGRSLVTLDVSGGSSQSNAGDPGTTQVTP